MAVTDTSAMTLEEAAATTHTGDIWLFKGSTLADRTIRAATNSPVNHVGMAVAIDDLPPLMWHAELGQSLPDVWTGEHHRGTQLHKLVDAVRVWSNRYGQRAWMRQIDTEVTREQEDALLLAIDELNGRSFPKTPALAKGWLLGRARRSTTLEALFCAEVVAITYERMGMLTKKRPPNWYDPGKFWSGDRLQLVGASLGPEIEITDIPPTPD
jgi:hypothetical protein